MRVEVTQEDIDRGQRRSEAWCPIARALDRTGPGYWFVTGDGAEYHDGLGVILGWYALPREARVFVSRFDHGRAVKPFSFNFDAEPAG